MSNYRSGDHKAGRKERFEKLPTEMQNRVHEFGIALQVCENSKDNYLGRMENFGTWLLERGIMRYEQATKKDLDLFLSGYKNSNTRNLFVQVFRSFYKDLKPTIIKHLKVQDVEIEEITPADILTPEEVIQLAVECGKHREMMKPLILTLFECACRISELLNLRLGDVVFSSVIDKEGKRKLIATLYFKRAKIGIRKQPVTIASFSADLKKWVDNHPNKGDEQAWLFPSHSISCFRHLQFNLLKQKSLRFAFRRKN